MILPCTFSVILSWFLAGTGLIAPAGARIPRRVVYCATGNETNAVAPVDAPPRGLGGAAAVAYGMRPDKSEPLPVGRRRPAPQPDPSTCAHLVRPRGEGHPLPGARSAVGGPADTSGAASGLGGGRGARAGPLHPWIPRCAGTTVARRSPTPGTWRDIRLRSDATRRSVEAAPAAGARCRRPADSPVREATACGPRGRLCGPAATR